VIEDYCAQYKDIFKEVRNYESCNYLHLGIIAPLERKPLPSIGKVVAIKSAHRLHHFITKSPGSVIEMKPKRLIKILK
jgi:SRSO17 transposase